MSTEGDVAVFNIASMLYFWGVFEAETRPVS